ncbi:MAG TPA: carboxypeptidase regulatory-like domain-containing protein [Terriglobales bacterium]|nr:carboxypeptidase regulatory-like domain-containing protein [Terriglobales bacterium]
MKYLLRLLALLVIVLAPKLSASQTDYQVVSVENGGSIKGTVKWSGPLPHLVASEINKDQQVCDPLGQKHRDLERLLIAPSGGVANTVVFLRNINRGKAMDLPAPRRFLNQKNCRYEPHILLVPLQATLTVRDSDPLLHTVQMTGSADYNLPFVLAGQEATRPMTREGKVSLRCNVHVWMNGEMMVARHPYYAVTDEYGNFELTQVPAGDYEIVAWHEGWRVVGESALYDIATQVRVKRPIFSDPVSWSKSVTVLPGDTANVNFTLGERTPQLAQGH